MTRTATVLSAALAAAGLSLATVGCAGDADPGRGGADAGDTASAVDSRTTGSAAVGTASADTTGDSRPLRARILRIVNPRGQAVVVTASAGLEAVVLDTVAAGDSAEVNVESRAPRVGLQALADGRLVGADSLDLTPAEGARWLVPSEGAGGIPGDTAPADEGEEPGAQAPPGRAVSSRPDPGRTSPRRSR